MPISSTSTPEHQSAISITTPYSAQAPSPALHTPIASWIEKTILIFSGISSLWYWNSILNLSETINDEYFLDYKSEISNLMTFIFEACAVLTYIICYRIDGLSVTMQLLTAILCFLFSLATPFVLLIPRPLPRLIMWLITAALFGGWMGLQQLSHFGLAANLPSGIKTVYVSTGQGISGIISYCIYWGIVKAKNIPPFGAICVQMVLLIFINLLGPCGMYFIRTQENVSSHINEQKRILLAAEASSKSPRLGLHSLLKKGWFPILNVSMTFMFSYIVFPNIGPFEWPSNDEDQLDKVMGFSQLGQVIGRSIPIFFIVSINQTFFWNCARIVLPIIYTIAAVKKKTPAFSSYWFQSIMLFTLSASEGWLASLGLLHSALAGDSIFERAELSKLSTAALTIAITIALALTFPLKAAVGI